MRQHAVAAAAERLDERAKRSRAGEPAVLAHLFEESVRLEPRGYGAVATGVGAGSEGKERQQWASQ